MDEDILSKLEPGDVRRSFLVMLANVEFMVEPVLHFQRSVERPSAVIGEESTSTIAAAKGTRVLKDSGLELLHYVCRLANNIFLLFASEPLPTVTEVFAVNIVHDDVTSCPKIHGVILHLE